MFKILRLPAISRPLTWILLFSFMTMISGCYYFKVTRSADPPQAAISKMQDEQKFIILHLDDKVWHLTDIIVNEESFTGSISRLTGHEKYLTVEPDVSNRYLKRSSLNESYVLNEVHVFITEYSETDAGKISVPIKAIQKIEIYDKASGATAASWVFGSLGVALGAFGVFLVIVALTKSSCPFVYAYNGTDFLFSGEIFSGATQPGLERDDYLPLPTIASFEGAYRLKLTNEVHEIQSVNLAGLIIVDHPGDVSVLIDKYGVPHTIKKPSSPVEAKNNSGKDILSLVRTRDTLFYSGDEKSTGENGIEKIFIKFIKPPDSESAKLIIRAKNSFWLDVLFTKFHKLFGKRYNIFAAKQESASGEKLNKFLIDQKIPLSVYLEKDGEWEFIDYFNIAGPMTLRDDILPLDLTGLSSDTVKIKLETGFLFWDVDFAGMDFSKKITVVPTALSVKSAIDQKGNDAKDLLLSTDKDYLVLKEVGDETLLIFDAPVQNNNGRSVFLHTRGFYKIIREQTGATDKKALRTFKKSNRFPEYSKEVYDLLPVK
jgi:hypothetical protein